MSNDLEHRLREALHAVPEPPPSAGAYERNLRRLQQRRRRTARARVALAAAAALLGVLALPALDLGRDDTLRPASNADERPAGDVVESFRAFGRGIDLVQEQEGRSGYRVCLSAPPHSCAYMVVLKQAPYTGVALPAGEGALLLLGSPDEPSLIADDLIVTGRPGAEPFRPPVEFVFSDVLGYRLAVIQVPTLEREYCVASHENGVGKSYAGIPATEGAGGAC